MNKYFIYFLFIISSVLIISCSKHTNKIEYWEKGISEFKNLNLDKQVKYINKLNKENRINFISKYIQNSSFNIPPYDFVKFYDDGDIIFDFIKEKEKLSGNNLINEKINYYLGRWEFKENKIFIRHSNKNINSIKQEEIWDDAEANIRDGYIFLIMKYQNEKVNILMYESEESINAISPAIESYTKLKEEQRRLQSQTKTSSITEASVK